MLTQNRKRKLDAVQAENASISEPVDHLSNLNVYCQLEILKYLDFVSILRMSRTSNHFLDVIKTRVISRREFVIRSVTGIYSTSAAFEYFGENMIKLFFGFGTNREFVRILSLMERYCSNERLKELHLHYAAEIYSTVVLDPRALFNNLECLTISRPWDFESDEGNMDSIRDILNRSRNLRKLTFDSVTIRSGFMTKVTDKLTELCFRNCQLHSVEELQYYLIRNRNVKKLVFEKVSFRQNQNLRSLIDVVTEHLPDKEHLNFRIQYSDLEIDSVQFGSMLKCNTLIILAVDENCIDIWNGLAKEAIIKNVEKLIIIENQFGNSSESEEITDVQQVPGNLELMKKTLPKFTNLHTIYIGGYPVSWPYDNEFYSTLFKCLPNLNKCILEEKWQYCDFDTIVVKFSKHLTILEIEWMHQDENKLWYERLLKIKLDRNDNFCLEIFIPIENYKKLKQELQASYQEKLIKLSVLDEKRDDPF